MSTKTMVIIYILSIAVATAVGRYTVSSNVIKTKEVTTEEQKQADKDVHTVTKTVVVKQPDGKEVTTTVTDTKSETEIKDEKQSNTKEQVVIKATAKINVSLLGSYSFQTPTKVPAVGLSISKEILGPVTAGVWGMNNGTLGVSIGLDF